VVIDDGDVYELFLWKYKTNYMNRISFITRL